MKSAGLMRPMAQPDCVGDEAGGAACFNAGRAYRDVFGGADPRPETARLVGDRCHRDATSVVWDRHEPVASDREIFTGVSVVARRAGLAARLATAFCTPDKSRQQRPPAG